MTLPPKQGAVYDLIRAIHAITEAGAPRIVVARKLHVCPKTVQGHAEALYRKGLLRAPGAPFIPVDPLVARAPQHGGYTGS